MPDTEILHPFAHSERQIAMDREVRKERKIRVLTYYGFGRCACVECGEDRIECLSIDHISNNGSEHRKQVGGGYNLYKWLESKDYPGGYQTLCMNCQFIKRHNANNYC